MDYPKFLEIIEVKSSEEANKYLNDKWTLLSTGFHQCDEHNESYHSYSLGYSERAHLENKYKKEDDDDYGF